MPFTGRCAHCGLGLWCASALVRCSAQVRRAPSYVAIGAQPMVGTPRSEALCLCAGGSATPSHAVPMLLVAPEVRRKASSLACAFPAACAAQKAYTTTLVGRATCHLSRVGPLQLRLCRRCRSAFLGGRRWQRSRGRRSSMRAGRQRSPAFPQSGAISVSAMTRARLPLCMPACKAVLARA